MDNTKQLEQFWIWMGFKKRFGYWHDPDDNRNHSGQMSLPPITLESLYKYAVPVLQKSGCAIDLIAYECSGFNCRIVQVVPRSLTELADERHDKPEVALFNALMKVVERETNAAKKEN